MNETPLTENSGIENAAINAFDTLRETLTVLADWTPYCAGAVALVAIFFALKNGLKKKAIAATVSNPGKWAWIAVAVLWVVVMLNYFDRQLLAVLNKSITSGENGIAMTQSQFGLVTSAFLVVYALLSPVGGFLADKFSRKFIILCSLVVWSVVTWLTGKAETFEELLVARAAMGISEAFYIPAALALISDFHRGNTRSIATGLHMSGIYAGQMLAGCGALMAGDPVNLGWRLTFEAFGFIGVAYAIIVIFLMRDPGDVPAGNIPLEKTPCDCCAAEEKPETENVGIADAIRGIFTGRAMVMLLAMYAFAGFANWFLMGWYPRLLQDLFGISESDAGPQATFWINAAKYGAVLLAAVAADFWYSRDKRGRAFVPGICFCVAGPCVIFAMLPVLGAPFALGLAATLALVATQGVAQGSLDATLMPVLRSHIDERFSATGYGLLNLTSVSAGALISWLGGFLLDKQINLGVPLCVAGVLMFICGVFFFLLPKPRQ